MKLRILTVMTAIMLIAGCDTQPRQQTTATIRPAAQHKETQSGFANVAGARIAYRVFGDLDTGQTPLVIMHGSLMSGKSMQWLVDQFTATRPVVTVDARGHGQTGDVPGPITYATMADDTAAVLRQLHIKQADLFGYSMGGTTAVVMAVRHPELVGKQVIMSGVPARSGWHPLAQASFEKWSYDMFKGSPVEAAYKRESVTPNALPSLVPKLRALESENYDVGREAQRGIRGKTMIIFGDADGVSFPEMLKFFIARGGDNAPVVNKGLLTASPRARLAVLPATSHIGMSSEGPLIAQLVMPFLDDKAPPPPTGFFAGMDKPGPDE